VLTQNLEDIVVLESVLSTSLYLSVTRPTAKGSVITLFRVVQKDISITSIAGHSYLRPIVKTFILFLTMLFSTVYHFEVLSIEQLTIPATINPMYYGISFVVCHDFSGTDLALVMVHTLARENPYLTLSVKQALYSQQIDIFAPPIL
tara:strand:+ start:34 stop:474 length:441 start_codon:yes stop_codon:yes gene_type:complete